MKQRFRQIMAAGTAVVMLAAVPLLARAAAERFTDVKPGAWYYTAADDAVGEITIVDTVKYSGLIPGKEYTVKGVLMDKATEKRQLIGGKEVASEVTFSPEISEGEVTVTFQFNASSFKEKTELVVFETLYRDGKELSSHADINDVGQTVTLTPEKPKTPTPDIPKTGDNRSIVLPLILLGSAFAGMLALLYFRSGGKHGPPQTGSKNGKK